MSVARLIMPIGVYVLVAGDTLGAVANPSTPYARLTSIVGTVRVRAPETTSYINGKSELRLYEGAEVLTAENSFCKIWFTEGRRLRMAPRSRLVITRLSVPNAESGRTLLHLLKGRVRAISERVLGQGGDFGFYAAGCLTAVKGADYEMLRQQNNEVVVSVDKDEVIVAQLDKEDVEEAERALQRMMLGQIGALLQEGFQMNVVSGKPLPAPALIPSGWFDMWVVDDEEESKPKRRKSPALPGPGGGLGIP